jgi:ankyrin repeat protein
MLKGGALLHVAANQGHVDAVRVLAELGADVEASYPDGARARPLHQAAYHGQVAVVKTLIELGADKEAADAEGSTPLHVAAHQGHVPVVKTLIELGADKEASTAEGIHTAARGGTSGAGGRGEDVDRAGG